VGENSTIMQHNIHLNKTIFITVATTPKYQHSMHASKQISNKLTNNSHTIIGDKLTLLTVKPYISDSTK